MPLIEMLRDMLSNRIMWRIFNLFYAGLFIGVFLGSITHETGGSSIYPFVLPIVGSIALILYFSKIARGIWIQIIGYFVLIYAFSLCEVGTFTHYTLLGLGVFTLFFNALRPWGD